MEKPIVIRPDETTENADWIKEVTRRRDAEEGLDPDQPPEHVDEDE